jgi:peptidoglycan hydrolase-like protein with peptidoglycan-binding domain
MTPQPIAVRRNDPIADLIGPSPRIATVQRALSDYGYGQLKPTGLLDEATSAAIEKFEREHRMPVTGRVSERLLGQLAVLVGHPIE